MIENKKNFETIQQIIAFESQYFMDNGIFITSEPSVSRYWIELDKLSKKIIDEKLKDGFINDTQKIINRVIKDVFGFENNNVRVINFCNEGTSLSDKDFNILYNFKYNNEALNVFVINEEVKFDKPQLRNLDIILLTAIDSNVTIIKNVLEELKTKMDSKVVAIVTIFSLINL